jgi:hypothetical protein
MESKVEVLKEKFILNEIWQLTINGAFQRANVYSNTAKGEKMNKEKEEFKKELREFVESLSIQYKSEIKDIDQHYSNIYSISTFSEKHESLLKDKKLNFGISQKLLNLYLKYLWCLGKIETPPHFPVDRQIQELLDDKNPTAWTSWENKDYYNKVIDKANKRVLNSGHSSIAELELELFFKKLYC